MGRNHRTVVAPTVVPRWWAVYNATTRNTTGLFMGHETYREQITTFSQAPNLDFWRQPEGVAIPDDELRFLLVPEAAVAAATSDLAQQVEDYQSARTSPDDRIDCGLMVTMGGLYPGVLLYDHLIKGRRQDLPPIQFGTVGAALYKGPGELLDSPRIVQEASIPVSGKAVLLIDDLVDLGGTMRFLKHHLEQQGARKTLSLVLYMKPAAQENCPADFFFGELAQHTWVITPRELVETLVKRVPVWRERGASQRECRRRLVELIGYPEALVDRYLPRAYEKS